MLNLQRAKKNPALFRRITGLTVQAFDELIKKGQPHYRAFEQKRLARPDRQRALGAGGQFKLSLEERGFMTLFALRTYPTWALLGYLFDLHESNAFRDVAMIRAFLSEQVPLPERARKQRIGSLEELLDEMPGLRVIIDGTEQEVQRPKEKEQRKRAYSGRKKRCTVKTQVVSEEGSGLIMDTSSGHEGSKHDLTMLADSGVVDRLPSEGVEAWTDKGYVGVEGVVPVGWGVHQPKKKPRGGELSEAEKASNREVNGVRIQVEHRILAMKQYRVLKGVYRGREGGYGSVVDLVAGLVNLERMRALGMEWAV